MSLGSSNNVLRIFVLMITIFGSVISFGKIIVSHESGFYDKDITVAISSDSGGKIYYTIDGSVPTVGAANTFLYSNTLLIQKSLDNTLMYIPSSPFDWKKPEAGIPKATVLRIIEVTNGKTSDSTSRTYFIGINHNLPVVSLITDSSNLFDEEKGIYVPGKLFDPSNPDWTGNYHQRGDDWERSGMMEYFENGVLKYRSTIGMRIHGEFSRTFPIKSIRLYARNTEKEFTYPFFGKKGYKKILLRNAGNDWNTAYMRDAVAQSTFKTLNFDTQDSYPVIHYINGEYWGIVYMMEYYDVRYLQVNYGVNEKNTVIVNADLTLQDGKDGDEKYFLDLINFVKASDLSIKANYDKVSEMMDIDNFIDFKISEILAANTDWPGNNERTWRVITPESGNKYADGRWRWMMYDMDLTMWNIDHNTLKTGIYGDPNVFWTMDENATILLKKLLQNDEFKSKFVARFLYIVNNIFTTSNIDSIIEYYKSLLENEMPLHLKRWPYTSVEAWQGEVEWLKLFASERQKHILSYVQEMFPEAK